MTGTGRILFALSDIYAMINMVKSVFYCSPFSTGVVGRIYVIGSGNHNYNVVVTRIRAKQQGLCRFCGRRIKGDDIIISKAYCRRPKYFHKECAERINLL